MHGRTYMDLAVMEGLCLSATNRAELQKPDLVSSWCIGLSTGIPGGLPPAAGMAHSCGTLALESARCLPALLGNRHAA